MVILSLILAIMARLVFRRKQDAFIHKFNPYPHREPNGNSQEGAVHSQSSDEVWDATPNAEQSVNTNVEDRQPLEV